jgi:hypothetical protein
MRTALACVAFLLSLVLYACVAVIFLHPLYVFGWEEGWRWVRIERDWLELAIIAALLLSATVLLVVGLSFTPKRPPPA